MSNNDKLFSDDIDARLREATSNKINSEDEAITINNNESIDKKETESIEDKEDSIDDLKKDIEAELIDYDNQTNKTVQDTLNLASDTVNDFVKNDPGKILRFIQESSRNKRRLVQLKEDIEKTKKHYMTLIKSNIQERKEIMSLKTGKERGLAVDKIILEEFDFSFDDNISKLQNRINFYHDEINLARDIYKLKSLVLR